MMVLEIRIQCLEWFDSSFIRHGAHESEGGLLHQIKESNCLFI